MSNLGNSNPGKSNPGKSYLDRSNHGSGFKKDPMFLTFMLILLILSLLFPEEIREYPRFVDWRTILALTGLLILTTGVRESVYFLILAKKTLRRIGSERGLGLSLVILTFLLSPVLTNDIALFITIPLTLGLQELLDMKLSKLSRLIVLEAIAANAGSTLTPIGNPQNLFLWHSWDVSFLFFVKKMLPLTALFFIFLIFFAVVIFKKDGLTFASNFRLQESADRGLFSLSFGLIVIYVLALEVRVSQYLLPFIVLIFLVSYRKVLKKVDWLLLPTFVIVFIDFHLLSMVGLIQNAVNLFSLTPANVFILSIFTSQLMSNVPAAIFISKFSHHWLAICYGVNLGGNGVVLASFANLIALRLSKGMGILIDFHKISLPYLFLTGVAAHLLFFGFNI